MKLPRFMHKVYALLFGYFWDRCPVCDKYFGGHEKHGTLTIPTRNGVLFIPCYDYKTCCDCAEKAKEISKELLLDIKRRGNHESNN